MTILAMPPQRVPDASASPRAVAPQARPRHYLMCRPDHFDVRYAINPWMDPSAPVDRARALAQWDDIRLAFTALGHRVDVLPAEPDLPDMVFAANGAIVRRGRALGSRFAYPQRAPEAAAHARWLRAAGLDPVPAQHVLEGEGDLLVVGERVLAGSGFRTDARAHAQAGEVLGVEVVPLELVDPRYYHLDTCLAVLGDDAIALYPPAFSAASRRLLQALYPDAIEVDVHDAAVLGLNAVSDGKNVLLSAEAERLAEQLAAAGYRPVPLEVSELRKAGGGVKCCTLELHR